MHVHMCARVRVWSGVGQTKLFGTHPHSSLMSLHYVHTKKYYAQLYSIIFLYMGLGACSKTVFALRSHISSGNLFCPWQYVERFSPTKIVAHTPQALPNADAKANVSFFLKKIEAEYLCYLASVIQDQALQQTVRTLFDGCQSSLEGGPVFDSARPLVALCTRSKLITWKEALVYGVYGVRGFVREEGRGRGRGRGRACVRAPCITH